MQSLPALREPKGFDEIRANAIALAPWLRSEATRIEEARRLPADVVDALKCAGAFRICMPRIWGGPELTSPQQVEVIAELAKGDASAAWCVMIGCDVGLYSAWLDPDVAHAMYPRLDMVQAGWVYPIGKAERVAGGYRVSGEWMFGSGCQHSDWMAGGCWVHENGTQTPEWRLMLAPRDEWEILDTWFTTGLRGTGSTDYRCRDLFVPAERSFSFFEPPKREGTLYRGHEALLRKMAGIPLGVGRAAIDDAIALLENKLERPLNRPYREMPRVQSAIGEAEAQWGSARAYLHDALGRQWEKLERGELLTPRERADVWLSRTNMFQTARSIARSLYDVVGGSAVYAQRSPFDRWLRDTETMCQHVVGQPKGYEVVGSMLLAPSAPSFHPML